jgi:hypothetical protein
MRKWANSKIDFEAGDQSQQFEIRASTQSDERCFDWTGRKHAA